MMLDNLLTTFYDDVIGQVRLDDNEYVGKIPCCWGVIAFAPTLEKELLSVLEDWILVGLKLNHPLPII